MKNTISEEMRKELLDAGFSKAQVESTVFKKFYEYLEPKKIVDVSREMETQLDFLQSKVFNLSNLEYDIKNKVDVAIKETEQKCEQKLAEINPATLNESITQDGKELIQLYRQMMGVAKDNTTAIQGVSYILYAFYMGERRKVGKETNND